MDEEPDAAVPRDRFATLAAENDRLRAALAAAGVDVSQAQTATATAEGATRVVQVGAATAAADHARDMAIGRADLADATEINLQLEELNNDLQASEERFHAVIGSATDHAIISMDFDGRITGWSPGAERVLGWTAAEAIGQDGAIVWTSEDRAAGVPERERELADATGSAADDRWHMRRDGTRFWGSGHLTPLRNGRRRSYLKMFRDRTAERQIEETLRESETRHRLAMRAIDGMVFEWDVPTGHVTRSDGLRHLLGFAPEEVEPTEAWWGTRVHPDDLVASHEPAREAMRRGEPRFRVEARIRHRDGRWVVVRDIGEVSYGKDGLPLRVVGSSRDVTIEKEVEDALRLSEEKLRSLFNAIDEGLAVVEMIYDDRGEIIDMVFRQVNAAYERQGGIHDVIGRSVTEMLPGVEEVWLDRYKQVARTGEPIRVEDYQGDVDRWFDVYFSRIDKEGRFVAIVFKDISERKRAELALRESEDKFRSLFEGMYEGVSIQELIFDAGGRVVDWIYREANSAFETQRGFPNPYGKRGSEVNSNVDQQVLDDMELVARTGMPKRSEIYVSHIGRYFRFSTSRLGGAGSRLQAAVFEDVTDRRRAEAALRESEERKAFLLKLSDAVRPLARPADIQGETTRLLREELNVGWCYYVDWDLDRKIGLVLGDSAREGLPSLVGAHDVSETPELLQVLADGAVRTVRDYASYEELPARIRQKYVALGFRSMMMAPLVKDGRLIATLLVGDTQVRDWSGSEASLLVEVAERTWAAIERARAEAALRESEARFSGFAENSADVLWISKPGGAGLDYLSPSFNAMFGEPRARIMADIGRFMDLVHPDDRASVTDFMPRALAGETAIAHYRVVRPSDGKVTYLRDTGFPIRDAEGRVVRVAGVVQDINDIVHATATLEAEKERFRTLAEGIPQLVWRSASYGHWTWASPQWTAFTGLSNEASRGRGWLDAIHPDDRADAMAAWNRAGAGGVLRADYRLRRLADGEWRWFQTRGRPVQSAGEGSAVEWLGTSTDVDDQVRTREAMTRDAEVLEARVRERTAELMAAEESLRQSQKMEAIGQLTGGIAHDFNNMLQGVVGGLDMARRRMKEGRGEDTTRYMAAACDAAGRAAGLTRRLLAFARRQRLEPRSVDADALIAGMADLVQRSVGPAIALELVPRNGKWLVLCDPSELESAVLNLCINARDAMPDGGQLTIATEDFHLSAIDPRRADGEAPGDYVAIRVEDTGVGIPPEILDRVLEPFFTTKPQGQGTGLGLSQVWGFVRQSGGLFRIASTLGCGTSVRILLPRGPADQPEADAEAAPSPATGNATGTVLLVDDETAVRVPAGERLRDLGYRVVEAVDGPTALRLLDGGLRPDLLITDMGLPGGMNGRQVAEAVREHMPELRVLFITGYTGTALAPGSEVIGKPFELDVLARQVQAHLAGQRDGEREADPSP